VQQVAPVASVASTSAAPVTEKPLMMELYNSGAGTKGTPVQVEVNYFPMNLSNLINEAFHYDLTFKPPGPRKLVVQALGIFMESFYADFRYGFDGKKNMYTNKKMSIENEEEFVKIEIPSENVRKRVFEVKIQYTNSSVDLEVLKK
jgi:N-terminal domain of argonaute